MTGQFRAASQQENAVASEEWLHRAKPVDWDECPDNLVSSFDTELFDLNNDDNTIPWQCLME